MPGRLTALLGCELPLQLAPMGSVSATPALPLAVAAAGGHGMYPGLALPPQALAPVLAELGRRTRAFGVNFIVGMLQDGALDVALEHAPYVDFFLADPDPALIDRVHAAGAVCGWQVESAREAQEAQDAGADVVIAKGVESGGRKRLEGPALLPLLDAVLEVVTVPVVAAGGIATPRGVAAAMAAGADGVRVGTRFIASEESDAHPVWIEAVLAAGPEDSVVSHAFNVGMPQPGPHRVLRSSIAAAEAREEGEVAVLRMSSAEIPVPRFGPQPPTRQTTGDVAAMALYAGESAGAVREVRPAAEIVAELATGLPGR